LLSRLAAHPEVERGDRCRLAGRTLLELLVVIGIIAGLIGLFITAALQALKAANSLK